ncbi:unnamed protein product [Linum tenue]|uniref:60S ribosomal protein L35a n=1 Tax=Linum tenue TaxID=586396 RepID=A0AAV0NGY3_9ROSI|nr:unnamed protein product [Linum tenue]
MIYCTNGWNFVGGNSKSKSNQYASTSLIQIEGVNTKKKVNWYQGKHLAYVYKAKVNTNRSHSRCIWGKVSRPHGKVALSELSSSPTCLPSPWLAA